MRYVPASTGAPVGTSDRPWQDYVLLVALACIFGSNFMMTKITVTVMEPAFVVTMRLLVATIALALVMLIARAPWPRGRIWIAIIASAIFGHLLPFSLLAHGQQVVDAGIAAILMATMPLFTLGLAQLFTADEKPNRYSTIGFAVALVGIIILFGPERLASLDPTSVAQYIIALAAISYGINSIITKSLFGQRWEGVATAFMGTAFLMSLPLLAVSGASWPDAPANAWAALVYTGVGPTATGAVLVVLLIRRAGASFASQINFVVPVVGTALAIIFLGESLPNSAWLALIIILVGVAIARRRPAEPNGATA
ncbi:MAG: DMT family transporter [Pseudomonadota bacterium]